MVNYKGSLLEECSLDAIVVDQLLILVSHLLIFGPIVFRRVSNKVVVIWKKFLKASSRSVFCIPNSANQRHQGQDLSLNLLCCISSLLEDLAGPKIIVSEISELSVYLK